MWWCLRNQMLPRFSIFAKKAEHKSESQVKCSYHTTLKGDSIMLYTDYTTDLLGLKDVNVTKVETIQGQLHIHLTTIRRMQVYPSCRYDTKRIHSYRNQLVKDIPFHEGKTILHLKKRRYFCPHCGKVFQEKVSFLPRYQRNTSRLVAKIMSDYRSEHSTISIARQNGISPGIAMRILNKISYPRPSLPRVLSIDEFKGNAEGDKFQCILTDPVRKRVLDILPSRKSETLLAYFLQYPLEQRKRVEYLVMDMSHLFRDVLSSCFPNAKIVVDKFHVCRHITWALERVRKEEQKKFSDDRRKYYKKSRWILLKHKEKLNEEQLLQLENMLSFSDDLRKAYWLKEVFYEFMESKNLQEARARLLKWNMGYGAVPLKEFQGCFEMMNRWQHQILRAFSLGYTNGFTEGCNNKIKVLKRNCYGVRNFHRFRNRILHMMAA